MDTKEAMEYLRQMHGESDSQPTEPATSEATEPATGVQPAETQVAPEPESEVAVGSEPNKTEGAETAAEQQQRPAKKKPSRQEQINHSFERMKHRHKGEIEAKDREIAERDKRIAELESTVAKYSGLNPDDFGPNEQKSYIDHRFALQNEQRELDQLKADRDRMEAEERYQESKERHEKQVDECFADEAARDSYWRLLANGGEKFQDYLKRNDKSNTIDEFLGDSPIAPLMIATLMRNPSVLEQIISERSPKRKEFALMRLESRLQLQRKIGQSMAPRSPVQPQQAQPQQKPRPTLPIVGSMVANPGTSAETHQRDWNRYLNEHPRGAV